MLPGTLRSIAAITLGLGALDLAVISFALGPEVVRDPPTHVALAPPPPPPFAAAATPPPPVVKAAIDDRIYFTTGSAALDARGRTALAALATQIGDRKVTLEGHADVRGPEALNLALSRHRAEAVAAGLERLGIDRARIESGFAGARDANSTELWRDRRVDIHIGAQP